MQSLASIYLWPLDIDLDLDLAFIRLMQSLASVANCFPESIVDSIRPKEAHDAGVYSIRMWSPRRKHYFYLLVDDYLPTKTGTRPYFSRCNANGDGMWVTLVEKAFAKLQGSFANLSAHQCKDNPASALVRLLGGNGGSREWKEEHHEVSPDTLIL